jgi:hypothetical protein
MPRSLATWEDLEALKQRFPRAPAWGQAGSEGREGVSNQHQDDPEDGPSAEAGLPRSEPGEAARRKGTRTRRPNRLIMGPQWA